MNKYLNILFLLILLLTIFLARQPFAQKVWPNIYENIIKPVFEKLVNFWRVYIPKIIAFFQKHIISKITREVEKRKEIAEEEFKISEEPKQVSQSFSQFVKNVWQNVWQNIKNFIFDQFKKLFQLK